MVVRWLLLLLVPVSILMVPVPSGLTPLAWKIFAVYIAAILGLILRPAGEAVVMLSVIAFLLSFQSVNYSVVMVTALCGWYLQLFLLRRLLLIQGLVDVLLTG